MNQHAQRDERLALIAVFAAVVVVALLMLQPAGAASVAKVSPGGLSSNSTITPKLHSKVTCAAGTNPEYVAYNPVTKWFYVTNPGSSSVSVYKASCTPVGTITLPTGAVPRGVVYNPDNNRMYVADSYLNQVYIINKLTIKQTLADPSFDGPWALVYDPANGYWMGGGSILVTNVLNDTVSAISEVTPTGTAFVFSVFPVGIAPLAIAYEPVYDTIEVVNEGSDNVTVVSASYLTVFTASISVGSIPVGIACSQSGLLCYVANEYSNNVSVIDPYGVWTTVAVGTYPFGVAYDPATLNIWVSNYGSHNISIISAANVVVGHQSLPKADSPVGMAWNYNSGKMDVAIWSAGIVDSV